MAVEWKSRRMLPGESGMAPSADPRTLNEKVALLLKNTDFTRVIGALRKSFGFDESGSNISLPGNMEPHQSIGWFPYVERLIGPGGGGVFPRWARLIVQVKPDAISGFDWYEIDYSLNSQEWQSWSSLKTEADLFGDILTEESNVEPMTWRTYIDEIRGVSAPDNVPIRASWVSRVIAHDDGFFHDYTHNTDQDAYGTKGIFVTVPIPKTALSIEDVSSFDTTAALVGFNKKKLLIIAIPVYDGHQIANWDHVEAIADDNEPTTTYITDESDDWTHYTLLVKHKLQPQVELPQPTCPRFTGINLYLSQAEVGEASEFLFDAESINQQGAFQLLRHIDTRTGSDYILHSFKSPIVQIGVSGQPRIRFENGEQILGYKPTDDEFIGFWVEIEISAGVYERYKITDFDYTESTDTVLIDFLYSGVTAIEFGSTYNITIRERWSLRSGTVDVYEVKLRVDFKGFLRTAAPPWLPNANDIFNADNEIFDISPKYGSMIEFEQRNFIGNIVRNGKAYPLEFDWSEPIGSPFAGYDLFPHSDVVPSTAGDEIMGFSATLNVLSVYTKYNIYRYVFRGDILVRYDEHEYRVGLAAPKSLSTNNGIARFFGQKGTRKSFFRYDGVNPPVDIGEKVNDLIEEALKQPGVDPSEVIGWYDPVSNQYRSQIRAFEMTV